jgi:phosphoribosylanthranilate isomerase
MTKIKVCGLTNLDDALECVRLGVDYLGFVFANSPRRADPTVVKRIRKELGNSIRMVGVFTEESDEVLEIADRCGLDFVQLHGEQSEDFAKQIGSERIIRVMRVSDVESLSAIHKFRAAKFYLFDTYAKKIQGGTGTAWDWHLFTGMDFPDKQIFLAGGINAENVCDAINTVHPYAIDVSSGAESAPGMKDFEKLERLVHNVTKCD